MSRLTDVILQLVIAILFVQAPNAGALPVFQSLHDQTGYDESFEGLVQKTSIIGRDDRGPLLTKGPELGLSAAEIKQIRQATGYIVCPGKKFNNPTTASAALIGSNGQIITAAHVLIDDIGHYREPLSSCYFQNQESPFQRTYLDVSGPESANLRIGKGYPTNHADDYAVVKLKAPIKGAKAFPVDLSQRRLTTDQKTYLVSAIQEDLTKHPEQPIIQACNVGELGTSDPRIIYGQCDVKSGASGGVHLVRDASGQLVMKALLLREGFGKDGQEYNKASGVYSYSVGIDGPILDDLKSLYPSLDESDGAVRVDQYSGSK